MTSSLVGSEMCIRDSREEGGRSSSSMMPWYSKGGKASKGKGKDKGKGTVSYTHLTLPTICSV
eukprot:9371600-Prorocentrum_lima.AAC.1